MVAAAVPLVLLSAPGIVGALIAELGFSPKQAGYLISIELGGMALATVPALFWVHRIDWRIAMRVALLLAAVADFASAWCTDFTSLASFRALASLGQGSAMLICMTSIGMSRNPDANYGWWTVGQLALGAIALAVMPRVLPVHGIDVFYLFLGGLMLVLIPSARTIPTSGSHSSTSTRSPLPRIGLAALASVFVFYIGISGVWTFAERIADEAGFSALATGDVLAKASIVGIFGALAAALLGTRLGRTIPVATALAISLWGIFLLREPQALSTFTTGAYAFKFAWTFIIPYLLAIVATLDPGGRLVVLVNMMIGGGLAVGPAVVAALLSEPPGYAVVSTIGLAATLIGGALIVPALIKMKNAQLAA